MSRTKLFVICLLLSIAADIVCLFLFGWPMMTSHELFLFSAVATWIVEAE